MKKMKQSVGQIAAIRDPLAVGPLVVMINKEESRYFKGLFIDALLNIGNGPAAQLSSVMFCKTP